VTNTVAMMRQAPCKMHDLKYHFRITTLMLQGISCRQAVMQITGERPGQRNFERLYRNHLDYTYWYEQLVEAFTRERCDMEKNSEFFKKSQAQLDRAFVRMWHEDYWRRFRN